MVSQDTTPTPHSSILHHFLISSSDPINTHFETQNFNPCEALGGLLPTIHSLGHGIGPFGAPSDANRLSLSLGSQGIGYMGGECTFVGTNTAFAPSMASIIHSSSSPSHSRFMRPAQHLLEEFANVGAYALESSDLRRLFLSGSKGASAAELRAELLSLSCSSSTDKHQGQFKISELIALLEQVERRYEEYCNKMEEVVSSFEVIAGEGSGRTYTALALEAMCRHFRSLRESVLVQIKVAMKKLCPEPPNISTGLSKLSLFDRGTRQNRMTLQQLGLMQQCQKPAWRPIRGLPETSVATLRAWLFEHFLHPYPNDSEKLMLASQTGLTKNQVANWFINARVRFWKPMIEEMYREEFGDSSSPGDSDSIFSSSCSSIREAHHDPVADDY